MLTGAGEPVAAVLAAASAAAVAWQRSSGLETTATRGTGASRAARACTWARPASSSTTPGVRPARRPEALAAVRP